MQHANDVVFETVSDLVDWLVRRRRRRRWRRRRGIFFVVRGYRSGGFISLVKAKRGSCPSVLVYHAVVLVERALTLDLDIRA